MQREIKFRGKRLDGQGWAFGSYIEAELNNGIAHEIVPYKRGEPVVEVDPETVGEYTGLKDTNGRDIYEGDIIDINYKYYACGINGVIPDQDCACLGVVIYDQYTAAYELRLIKAEYPIDVKGYDEEYSLNLDSFDLDGGIELCGNIHDNPDLLETE